MLMRGDINKIIAEFNGILEGAFERIQALEDKVMKLEAPSEEAKETPKRRGRPPKENKEF